MRGTTFEMSINGVAYRVFNGTEGDCVIAENIETGVKVVINEDGTYANKTCVRRAILRHAAEFEQVATVEPETDNEFEAEETEEATATIEDVIYRNLPKYVQNAISYCYYADKVYRIFVNTEFGSKEISAEKWADVSAKVKTFCKTGAEA